jgi:hypothetical protein
MDRRGVSVTARTTLTAGAADVFGLLSDLDRHRELTDRGIRILDLDGPPGRRSGGFVSLKGPAGLTRLARTQVRGAEPHCRLWGTAETPDGARASLEWRVSPQRDVTHVEVQLDVRPRRWRDRLLLHLGGRLWLRARLRAALHRLARIASPQPEFS